MTSTLISASVDTSFTPNNCAPLSQQRSERTSSTADNERRAKRQGSDHSDSAAKLMRSTSTSVTMSNEPARTDDDNEEAEGMNETDLFVQSRYSGVAQEDRSEDSDVKVVTGIRRTYFRNLDANIFFIANVGLTSPFCLKIEIGMYRRGRGELNLTWLWFNAVNCQ